MLSRSGTALFTTTPVTRHCLRALGSYVAGAVGVENGGHWLSRQASSCETLVTRLMVVGWGVGGISSLTCRAALRYVVSIFARWAGSRVAGELETLRWRMRVQETRLAWRRSQCLRRGRDGCASTMSNEASGPGGSALLAISNR